MGVLAALALAATLTIPGRVGATPSIAAQGALVVVVFSATDPAGTSDIFAAVSRDGGRRFGAAVRVNDVPGDARVNGEQSPRVDLVDQHIVVVWTSKGGQGTRLLQARSTDGGRTFSKAAIVAGTDARGNRGWESIAGSLALWLDHRELAADSAAPAQHVHAGGEMMTEKSKLYIGSLDGTIAPHAIASGVCYCCKTAIATSGANVFAAWRHVFPGSVRDIAFTVSHDAGRTFAAPVRVSDDRWVLQGCPENGPALGVDARQRVHVVWPTLTKASTNSEDNLSLFYAASDDGKTFTPRRQIVTQGTPRHPQTAVSNDGLVVAWDETASGHHRAIVSHVTFDQGGAPTFSREVLGDGTYPVVAISDAPVAAWASPDGIRVERAMPGRATSR
jgi:hypothetical protein